MKGSHWDDTIISWSQTKIIPYHEAQLKLNVTCQTLESSHELWVIKDHNRLKDTCQKQSNDQVAAPSREVVRALHENTPNAPTRFPEKFFLTPPTHVGHWETTLS